MSKEKEKTDNSTKNLEEQLKRALADYANLKKRFEKERRELIKFANESLLLNLLGLLEGLEMTLHGFEQVLEQAGFTKINLRVGEEFDAKTMEAIDGEGKIVAEILSPGYRLHNKVIKPARVRVRKTSRKEDKAK